MRIDVELINMRRLDELAAGSSVIHRLNPCAKVVTTLLFVLAVTSAPRHEISGLIPFFLYPAVLSGAAELPVGLLVRRVAATLPFILLVGIFNPLLETGPALQIGPALLPAGWASFFSIVVRSVLAVSAALILIGVTGMDGIGAALLKLRAPKALVAQLLFMYRYLYILIEEAGRMVRAHNLRVGQAGGVSLRTAGSLLGHLLLRTLDRAERVYTAMVCRGFDGVIRRPRSDKFRPVDVCFILGWAAFFWLARAVNIPRWLEGLLLGGWR